MNENIIEFKPREKIVTKIEIHEPTKDSCKHTRPAVDVGLRVVWCRDCESVLDPVQILIEFSHEQRTLEYQADSLEYRRFQKLQNAARSTVRRDLMKPHELVMDLYQLQEEHLKNGHPKERMYFDRNMVRCYCGSSWNVNSYPELAREVREAHERTFVR